MARIDELIVGETYAYSTVAYDPRPNAFGEFLGIEKVEKRTHGYKGKTRMGRMARFRQQGIIYNEDALPGKIVEYDEDADAYRVVDDPGGDENPLYRILDPRYVDPERRYTPRPFDPEAHNADVQALRDQSNARDARDRAEASGRLLPALNYTLGLTGTRTELVPLELNTLRIHDLDYYSSFYPTDEVDQIDAIASGRGRETLRLLAAIYEALGITTDDGEPLIAPMPEGA